MTTALRTTSTDDLTDALDGLAAAAEQAPDDPGTRAVLAVVVQRLEQAAGAELGDTCGDPLVVLQRRFGRAHARLARVPHLDGDLLLGLALALQPEPARRRQVEPAPVRSAALAGC